MPVNVPVDDPNADTEWNDILRSKGIIPEKPPSPTPIIEEALLEAQEKAHENRLEDKGLDELDELEDEEDEAFLQKYRQQRIAELSNLQKSSIHNQVYPLQKPDYARDVTEASSKYFVCVLLTSPLGTNVESQLLIEYWRELAKKYGNIKFCEMRADLCIEGYPERNTPTVLIYRNGDIVKQIVTLRQMKGVDTKIQDVERLLIDVKAIQENDVRIKEKDHSSQDGKISQRQTDDADDDDWD
ncbi:MAG: hypothetical protein Q9227_001185 [Pyrenula ochraceoflavens]